MTLDFERALQNTVSRKQGNAMKFALGFMKRLGRMLTIVLLVVLGSTLLVRYAPGYLSDAREMDPRYAHAARVELVSETASSTSVLQMITTEMRGWTKGDFGMSRQYEVPVAELILPRLSVTAALLLRGLIAAWCLGLGMALFVNLARNPSLLWQVPATLLLAVPTAALATLCLVGGGGNPVLVMALLLAARDFKFLDRLLRKSWREPHLLQARAQGIPTWRILCIHLVPTITPQLLALVTLSILTGLSALVPVEVIFNVPGLGQLAWAAAMNRDLPVLLAVTVLMAVAVTMSGIVSDTRGEWRAA